MRKHKLMTDSDEDDQLVCSGCVGETYLSERIANTGDEATCDYCQEDGICWPLSDLADVVEAAFERHYVRTSDEPDGFQSMMLRDRESTYEWDRDGEQTEYAVGNAVVCDEDLAKDLQEILEERHSDWDAAMAGEESEFHSEAHYEEQEPNSGLWDAEWRGFEASLKHETRYFNAQAHQHLSAVFNGLNSLTDFEGRPVIVDAGPGTQLTGFYRARVFHSDKELEKSMARPDLHLGTPPKNVANSGRMNAHGVPVFYGADSEEGALAEVRPPVGSKTLIGRFNLIRSLRLLDFGVLENVRVDGSVFDPDYADRLTHRMFISTLGRRISRPVMPTDEAFEYLPTQAVADFLASSEALNLDGVLFQSVQTNRTTQNVVLFQKASRVAELDIPTGTEIDARTYIDTSEGPEPYYHVSERVPTPTSTPSDPMMLFDIGMREGDSDHRDAALEVNTDSLSVRVIKSASYETADSRVTRDRYQRPEHHPF